MKQNKVSKAKIRKIKIKSKKITIKCKQKKSDPHLPKNVFLFTSMKAL